MLNITLKEMLEEMVNCILNNKELNNYYWKDGEKNYHLITEVNLMYRIRTANDDFTEFEWELKENNVNKKAIYYGFYDTDWFDSSAVENFSENIIDLVEVGDIVEIFDVIYIWNEEMLKAVKEDVKNGIGIRRILTHEQFEVNCYKVKEE